MSVVGGIDESPTSRLVVERAIQEAQWRQTDVHLVYVTYMQAFYTEVAIDWTEILETQRAAVWSALQPTIERAEIEVSRVDLEGYPPDTLVQYASEVEASLLVVGTRGRGELASLILGSTSHRAIQLSECDVLVVKDAT